MRTVFSWLGSVLFVVSSIHAAESQRASSRLSRHPTHASSRVSAEKSETAPIPEETAPIPEAPVEKQTGFVVRSGMARISWGENVGTNADRDIGSYKVRLLQPFHMDITEVTWKQWKEVRDWAVKRPDVAETERAFYTYDLADTGEGKADDHPVTMVTWFDCLKWCNARSEKEGLIPCYTIGGVVMRSKVESVPDCNFSASGYRLPTAQEQEYAARGGLSGKRFPWGEEISHENANYYSAVNMKDDAGKIFDTSKTRGCHPKYIQDPQPYTCPVKMFAPNEYGLYDMAGNVSEWCWAPKGASRVTAGGSWDADARGLRNGVTSIHDGPGERDDTIGFRTVRRAGQ